MGPVTDTDDGEAFGRALRQLRKDRGWSMDQLADQLKARGHKITGAAIGAWERGEYAPRGREVLDLLDDILNAGGELHRLLGLSYGDAGVTIAQADAGPIMDRLDRIEGTIGQLVDLVEGLRRDE